MNNYVNEVRPMSQGDKSIADGIDHSKPPTPWNDPKLMKVTRLRLLTDPNLPYCDVSYCHGLLKDNTPVRVELPFSQLPRKKLKFTIVKYAIRDKINASRLGVLDAISILF